MTIDRESMEQTVTLANALPNGATDLVLDIFSNDPLLEQSITVDLATEATPLTALATTLNDINSDVNVTITNQQAMQLGNHQASQALTLTPIQNEYESISQI